MKPRYLIALAAAALLAGLLVFWPGGDTAPSKAVSDKADSRAISQATRPAADAHASLEGQVLNSDGEPLAGATVVSHPIGDQDTASAADQSVALTGADGRYAFSSLVATRYRVSATARGYLPAHANVELEAGKAGEIILRLEAGGQLVQGIVHDLIGGTVGAASVEFVPINAVSAASDTRLVTQSDEAGAYALSLPSGRYLAWASHPDYVAQTKMLVVAKGDQAIDFELAPGAEVEGLVLRASDDAPIPFARVSYASESGWSLFDKSRGSGWVSADAQGHFVITGLRSGSLVLHARSDNAVSAEPTRVALGIADHSGDVLLYVSDALRAKGRVLDAETQEPVAGMQVAATSEMGGIAASAKSAEDGSFVIEGLAARSYRFVASGGSYLPQLFAESIAVHENLDNLVIEVQRGTMIVGRVEPPQAAEIRVDIRSVEGFSNNAMQRAQSVQDGSFAIGPFSHGTFSLSAENSEGARGSTSVTVADTKLEGVVITLEESASLAGSVADARGKALDDVVVQLRKAGDRNMSVVFNGQDMLATSAHTSSDGSFLVVGLAEGEYKVRVLGPQGDALDWAATSPKKAAGDPIKMRFALAEHKERVQLKVETRDASIAGVVLGPDNKPAADVWVTASAAQPQSMLDGLVPAGLPTQGEESPAGEGEHEHVQSRMEVSMVVADQEEGESGAPGLDLGSAREVPPVLSNEKGEFVITGLREGLYDLRAEGLKGSARAFVREAKTGDAQTITLATLTRIDGLVRRGEEVVDDFVIEVQGKSQRRKRVHAKDGSFVLHRVDPGHYTIIARNSEGQAEAEIDVRPGAATKVTLQMETLTRVQGHIVDSSGAAIKGILVIAAPVQRGGGMEMMVDDDTMPTGKEGRFEIGLRPGNYMLIALDPGAGPVASRAFEVAGSAKVLDLGKITTTPGGGLPDIGGGE